MIFSFIISIINFRKTWRFRQIEKYFSLKSSLTPFLEKFEQSTKKDIFTEGVDAIEVDEIRQSMEHISALISLLSGPLIQFRRIGTSLPDEAKLVLEKFISLEMEWITETVKDFRISLSLWLGVHASELSAYEKEKLQSGNESLYSLSQSRLEAHREDIEKVMINL